MRPAEIIESATSSSIRSEIISDSGDCTVPYSFRTAFIGILNLHRNYHRRRVNGSQCGMKTYRTHFNSVYRVNAGSRPGICTLKRRRVYKKIPYFLIRKPDQQAPSKNHVLRPIPMSGSVFVGAEQTISSK